MAYIVRTTRVGRSQGASIIWGLVSAFFAAAACFYYWKEHDNESAANNWRDQALVLQDENETLKSQKQQMQASIEETETQLKAREDLIQQKETELATEESGLDELGQETQRETQQNLAQVAVVKKFNDLIHKLSANGPTDVVERGGRPVLRVPNAQLFDPQKTELTPAGKALLAQVAQGLNGQLDNFELRVVAYTDSAAEADPTVSTGGTPLTSWQLTTERAATLAQFFRDQTQLPFRNVLVMGRGDSEQIGGKDNPAHNRRVEITVTPLPVIFHAPDLDHSAAVPAATPLPANAGAAGTDTAKKAKPKTPDKPATP